MVSKKRLFYGGFDGFHAPVIPKAPRSLRRNSHKKSSGSNICPIELLAAVAGKLLQESKRSIYSIVAERTKQINIPKDDVKKEPLEVKLNPSILDYLDQGCSAESEFVPEPSNLELKLKPPLKELPQSDNDSGLEPASIVTTSDFLKEVSTDVKLEASDTKNGSNYTPSRSEGGSPSHGVVCDVNMGINRAELQTEAVEKLSEDSTAEKTCRLQDTVKSFVNHRVINKSYSSVYLPVYSDPVPSACFPRHRRNVKIGIRDDDENYFSCNHHSAKMRAFRMQSRARIRKMLTTKHWKSTPKLQDFKPFDTISLGVKTFDHNRKHVYMRERCQAEATSKRRKLFHHNSKPDNLQESSSESICNLTERSASVEKNHPPASLYRAKAVASSVICNNSSFQSKDGYVKFSIKSFQVPELYVEIPDTSTVGSLKRTVMEAMSSILEGELHVGVLLQGKKVRDDNRTLEQTGISLNSDTLGFMLESSLLQDSEKEPPSSIPCNDHQPLSRWRDVKIRSFDDANHRNYVDLKDKWKTLVHTASISPQQRRGEPVPQDLLDRVLTAHSFWSQNQCKPQGKHQPEPLQTPVKVCR